MLQDVTQEEIFNELDEAMVAEEGYPYITDVEDKMYALPPDEYEFELDISGKELLNIIKLICSQFEKKYNLKKTPIIIVEVKNLHISNLEELTDEDFQQLN